MAVLAGGCSGHGSGPLAVSLPAAAPDAPPAAAPCARVVAALPATLPGTGTAVLRRRPVAADPARAVAWGDPPVVLRCGVPPPDPYAEPLVVDGVAWVVRPDAGGQRWTTRGRFPVLDVLVPASYDSQADQLAPLSAAVARALPVR